MVIAAVPPVAVTVTALEVVRERVEGRLDQVHSRWEAEVGHRVIVNALVLATPRCPRTGWPSTSIS